jgi:hypothetical protein
LRMNTSGQAGRVTSARRADCTVAEQKISTAGPQPAGSGEPNRLEFRTIRLARPLRPDYCEPHVQSSATGENVTNSERSFVLYADGRGSYCLGGGQELQHALAQEIKLRLVSLPYRSDRQRRGDATERTDGCKPLRLRLVRTNRPRALHVRPQAAEMFRQA